MIQLTYQDRENLRFAVSSPVRDRLYEIVEKIAERSTAEVLEGIAAVIEQDRYVGTSGTSYGRAYYDGHTDAREEVLRTINATVKRLRGEK